MIIINYKNKKYYLIKNDFVIGYTNKNDEFYIDINDFPIVSQYIWFKNNSGYIYAIINGKFISLHRFVLNPKDDLQVDHINGNKIDCRKSNLRECTNSQNQANKDKQKNNTSGFKGITWHKLNKNWTARISYYGKRINIGSFINIHDAIKAYNKEAKNLYGEYAKVVRS